VAGGGRTRLRAAVPHEHLDVLIVGAGLSGIGAAHHLRARHPRRTFALLEAREELGGTWSLFRYPGVRSDSDMHTLGYAFRPWPEARAIADGPSILRYLRETARAEGLDAHIRLHHRVVRASWSSAQARWTVEVERTDTGEALTLTCGFLLGCTGYFRYDEGHTPAFPGRERFAGEVVHPQHWPAALDVRGRRVVVIGSGATAVTLVPALAETAARVTMLQRSPTWITTLPSEDPFARAVRRVLPTRAAFSVVRWKSVLQQIAVFQLSRRRPDLLRRMLRRVLEQQLPEGYDIDRHFRPRYDPWDQRLCLVPDGDLFRALRDGRASVVTDRIATFTETGLRLESGEELDADVVVTATGLNLLVLGGMGLSVDGEEVDVAGRGVVRARQGRPVGAARPAAGLPGGLRAALARRAAQGGDEGALARADELRHRRRGPALRARGRRGPALRPGRLAPRGGRRRTGGPCASSCTPQARGGSTCTPSSSTRTGTGARRAWMTSSSTTRRAASPSGASTGGRWRASTPSSSCASTRATRTVTSTATTWRCCARWWRDAADAGRR